MLEQRILRTFGRVTLDQILIHIFIPKELYPDDILMRFLGTGWKSFIILFILVVYCIINVVLCNEAKARSISNHIKTALAIFRLDRLLGFFYTRTCFVLFAISFLFFMCSFLYCEKQLNIIKSLISIRQTSDLIDTYYVPTQVSDFSPPTTKSNLVVIISESLESTYANEALFHENLIRELTKYRKPGNHVEDLYKVHGCTCTITSLYAQQYGLPILYLRSPSGTPVKNNLFNKNCISVFDVLNANGYSTGHLQGATLKFASHDMLYKSICNANVIGLHEIPKELYSSRQKWGLWDSDLFEIAKKEITEMAEKGPFALSILTVDTHRNNTLQPGAEREHGGGEEDIIRLQSKLIDKFIQWIQKSEFGKNTVIVLVGDHFLMAHKIGNVSLMDENSRRIFNVILNSRAKNVIQPNRKAAIFDFAPTVLDALGFEWPTHALGIGRSLYHEDPTIMEEHGLDYYNKEALKRSELYFRLINK